MKQRFSPATWEFLHHFGQSNGASHFSKYESTHAMWRYSFFVAGQQIRAASQKSLALVIRHIALIEVNGRLYL
jgi:hypothetical protein